MIIYLILRINSSSISTCGDNVFEIVSIAITALFVPEVTHRR